MSKKRFIISIIVTILTIAIFIGQIVYNFITGYYTLSLKTFFLVFGEALLIAFLWAGAIFPEAFYEMSHWYESSRLKDTDSFYHSGYVIVSYIALFAADISLFFIEWIITHR